MFRSLTSPRRRFLKKILAGIGAAVGFSSADSLSASGRRRQPSQTTKGAVRQGYRETGHIRRYYRTARF